MGSTYSWLSSLLGMYLDRKRGAKTHIIAPTRQILTSPLHIPHTPLRKQSLVSPL